MHGGGKTTVATSRLQELVVLRSAHSLYPLLYYNARGLAPDIPRTEYRTVSGFEQVNLCNVHRSLNTLVKFSIATRLLVEP